MSELSDAALRRERLFLPDNKRTSVCSVSGYLRKRNKTMKERHRQTKMEGGGRLWVRGGGGVPKSHEEVIISIPLKVHTKAYTQEYRQFTLPFYRCTDGVTTN